MEIFGLMSLGLFLGMTHAMDADHIAAVSAMWNRQDGKHGLIRRGLYWGAGHGIALLALCAVLLSTGQALSDQKQALLELGASLLILYLGGQLIWRMYRRRFHIHIHKHDGKRHLHMHSHLNDRSKPNATIPHDELAHDHKHATKSPFLALVVGLAHGAAGSGSLMVLAVTATQSITLSFLYVILFCIGALVGMGLLTIVVAMPLSLAGTRGTIFSNLFSAITACLCVWTGGTIAAQCLVKLGVY
jgi:ABC-type nickel/cobalt efflux system permease component RcnA